MAEQKTVIVLEVTHKKDLPPALVETLERKVYDIVSATTGEQVGVRTEYGLRLEVR